MAQTATKQHAHELIERMAPAQVPVAVEILEKMLDPVAAALANAPFEDEEIGEAEELAASKARAAGYVASPNSHEHLMKEFGLNLEDFERMGREPLEADDIAG